MKRLSKALLNTSKTATAALQKFLDEVVADEGYEVEINQVLDMSESEYARAKSRMRGSDNTT